MTGTIIRINIDRGFGFIAVPDEADIFVHCKDLHPSLPFDTQLIGLRVNFETVPGAKGLRAIQVRAA